MFLTHVFGKVISMRPILVLFLILFMQRRVCMNHIREYSWIEKQQQIGTFVAQNLWLRISCKHRRQMVHVIEASRIPPWRRKARNKNSIDPLHSPKIQTIQEDSVIVDSVSFLDVIKQKNFRVFTYPHFCFFTWAAYLNFFGYSKQIQTLLR